MIQASISRPPEQHFPSPRVDGFHLYVPVTYQGIGTIICSTLSSQATMMRHISDDTDVRHCIHEQVSTKRV
jgi:hypothetical protein